MLAPTGHCTLRRIVEITDINVADTTLKLRDLKANLEVSAQKLMARLNASLAEGIAQLSADVVQDFDKIRGSVNYSFKPINLTTNKTRLSRLIQPWPYNFDLVSGTVRLSGRSSWKSAGSVFNTVKLALQNGGGYYDNILFSGINTELPLTLTPKLQMRIQLQFR